MSLSPGVHGGHRLAGSSLLTVTAVLVCIQAEPDGEDLVSDVWFVYKRNGRLGIWFWYVQHLYTMYISPGSAPG